MYGRLEKMINTNVNKVMGANHSTKYLEVGTLELLI